MLLSDYSLKHVLVCIGSNNCKHQGVKASGFYVLLIKKTDSNLSHSTPRKVLRVGKEFDNNREALFVN